MYEIGRIKVHSTEITEYLATVVDLEVCKLPFYQVVLESMHIDWTRDPFDRLIVAQSIARDAKLMTKDQVITAHYSNVVW
ncbi:MAG: hypothetical protein EOL87_17200 [Spartobacteria bacterium]|nr:hypothetical protein [Spartobacteria bacterium]